jgi:hypothetical protein
MKQIKELIIDNVYPHLYDADCFTRIVFNDDGTSIITLGSCWTVHVDEFNRNETKSIKNLLKEYLDDYKNPSSKDYSLIEFKLSIKIIYDDNTKKYYRSYNDYTYKSYSLMDLNMKIFDVLEERNNK